MLRLDNTPTANGSDVAVPLQLARKASIPCLVAHGAQAKLAAVTRQPGSLTSAQLPPQRSQHLSAVCTAAEHCSRERLVLQTRLLRLA